MTESKKLTELFARLPKSDQNTLMDFALFLTAKNKETYTAFPTPDFQSRVEGESVIAAIKRLKTIYHMLNMDSMIDETSGYMTQHIVQGRDVNEVIDDLESSFEKHYMKQKEEFET